MDYEKMTMGELKAWLSRRLDEIVELEKNETDLHQRAKYLGAVIMIGEVREAVGQ